MRQEATTYFDGEGRPSMQECVNHSVEWSARAGIRSVVIFTGTGEGPLYAAKELLALDAYAHLRLVAVTPPVGREYRTKPGDPSSPVIRAGINPAIRDELVSLGVNVISAHLPFKEITVGRERRSEWSRVAEAYGVLGGGFSLCVQATLMACDAGAVESGERIVVASADTALVAIASRTESFLSPTDGLLVEHIICRPMRYNVSKQTHLAMEQMWSPVVVQQPDTLPEAAGVLEVDASRVADAPAVDADAPAVDADARSAATRPKSKRGTARKGRKTG